MEKNRSEIFNEYLLNIWDKMSGVLSMRKISIEVIKKNEYKNRKSKRMIDLIIR